ncbi:MAG: hypothetical protein WC334_08895 [Kiritimatiellales bacterium]|jgi:hypothetical protein
MLRTFDQILAGLAALKPEDFDFMRPNSDGPEQLNSLTEELMLLPQPERGVRVMFEVMERLPESDLGSPGPLVHTLEQMLGHYERELVESVKRKPTPLAIWMVNRILNATRTPEERQIYLNLLRFAAEHPAASAAVRHEAQHFIEYQSGAA